MFFYLIKGDEQYEKTFNLFRNYFINNASGVSLVWCKSINNNDHPGGGGIDNDINKWFKNLS
ncbi:hypothetical protein P344_05210 [Spiroplasma mirum ATCC 29335]|uniref:Uncharacterized protein n=1 Tax=Spiroplasma mirum ATCC 29335 TaxID=838561 RepID=W0GM54_9MOLU|nr:MULTISPECIES: hypothetical protein [Spiroplasma]AHF61262.1 hypothetical protein SMM_0872 [Spiroplasma mirum ATCC 29335]AHI58364.1 hypothetical protein P344_05210 [Spiroplasma mirum ATCC 29335]